MTKKLLVAALALSAAVYSLDAKVTLHHLIGDNMVLQQQTEARLYGYDEPGKTVKVTPSWDGKKYTVKTDKDGKWEVKVQTPAASFTPYEITFDDGEAVKIGNVLIGEVWVGAGQSNMEMPVGGFTGCPVDNLQETLVDAVNNSAIRYAKIPAVESMEPLEDAETKWNVISPETVRGASATAYFFARMLSRVQNVPVGIIEANKGGSRVESWLTRENLEKYTKEDLNREAMIKNFRFDFHRPMTWGYGTFNPILKYTVKGILFYQGCSNVGDPGNQYSERMKILAEQWRELFGLGEIPFFFVEIAPYAGNLSEVDKTWSARLREQQFRASTIIPNSGMVSTNDAVYPYEITQIHPAQKCKVGERLASAVLNKVYGHTAFPADSPSYKSMKIDGNKIYLTFDHMDGGFNRMMDIEGFEIAGEDHVFHPATCSQQWGRVAVYSEEVPAPVAVRYCFKNFQIGNFGNALGLPLIPFRTDDWEE